MKTLLHCHHSIGIGHLMRTLKLAEACLDLGEVCVICGGEMPGRLSVDSRIRLECLPPLNMASDGSLYDPIGTRDVSDIFIERQALSIAVVADYKPDCLVVEMFPFGRKKFAAEILGLIDCARRNPDVRVLCSVRDVLVTQRHNQEAYDRRAVDWLNENFDALLVHSDPTLISLATTFSAYAAIDIPIHYTGYVASAGKPVTGPRAALVVVSAGGGRVGKALISTARSAASAIRERLGCEMLLITGPMHNGTEPCMHATDGVEEVSFLPDLPDVLTRTRLSISQCGYNTATDVLRACVPAVFVPFEAPRENEQLQRAGLIAGCGRAVTLRESQLSAEALVNAACAAMSQAQQHIETRDIDLNGAFRSREIIGELFNHA